MCHGSVAGHARMLRQLSKRGHELELAEAVQFIPHRTTSRTGSPWARERAGGLSIRSTSSKASSTTLTANPWRLRCPSATAISGVTFASTATTVASRGEPRLGLDQELVESQAVGQLDAGQDLANLAKLSRASARRHDERPEPVVALARCDESDGSPRDWSTVHRVARAISSRSRIRSAASRPLVTSPIGWPIRQTALASASAVVTASSERRRLVAARGSSPGGNRARSSRRRSSMHHKPCSARPPCEPSPPS